MTLAGVLQRVWVCNDDYDPPPGNVWKVMTGRCVGERLGVMRERCTSWLYCTTHVTNVDVLSVQVSSFFSFFI